MEKTICGIYKITSPTNKIYIGQSVNISRRFYQYSKLFVCKTQIKLYRSLLKYGFNKHKFEIIKECSTEELNTMERYYQDLYQVISANGLNLILTSTETDKKVMSEETKLKISISNKGRKPYNAGKKLSEEHKNNIREGHRRNKGKPRMKRVLIRKKRNALSEEHKTKLSIARRKWNTSPEHLKKLHDGLRKRINVRYNGRIVLNTHNGIYYPSIVQAAESLGINGKTLSAKLIGKYKNNTQFILA